MYYPMENIENFRDLGGIRTKDGKQVKDGMLFRCAALSSASENDIQKIKELGIDTIVDFRSNSEVRLEKGPEIEGITYHHINLFKEKLEGVEKVNKEERFYEWMIRQSLEHPALFAEQMVRNYSTMVSEDQAIEGFRKFFDILLDENSERVLWHCSAGKDRTGIAAILLLEALDADRGMIRENYLLTNRYLNRSLAEVLGAVKEQAGHHRNYEAIRDAFATAMSASELFINACYKTMTDKTGSPEAYLEQYFHIDEEMKKKLKEKYCK